MDGGVIAYLALQALPSYRQYVILWFSIVNVVIQDVFIVIGDIPPTALVYAVFPTTVV
jgi:hypothetical protein